jgi:son of sevenless
MKNTIINIQFLQPRKWPELTLKSPGTKPQRRQNNSNSSSSNFSNTLPFGSKASHHFNTSESEQSPTATCHHSSSDFSVFAPVNIPMSSSSGGTSFTYSLSSSTSHATLQEDTISIMSTNAPELLPRRLSTSIPPSHNSHNNINHNNSVGAAAAVVAEKPLLSPRNHAAASVSPGRLLDSLTEDCRLMDIHQQDLAAAAPSPSGVAVLKSNPYQRAGIRNITTHESGISPSSPRHAVMELNHDTSNGHHHHHHSHHQNNFQQPISPHVNVPPNAHNFNHMPPPLPPRRPPKKNADDFLHSQMRQDPDAPMLMPRDLDPPPLPPRTHSTHHSNNLGSSNGSTWNHSVRIFVCTLAPNF